jgi:hypothetical protein
MSDIEGLSPSAPPAGQELMHMKLSDVQNHILCIHRLIKAVIITVI